MDEIIKKIDEEISKYENIPLTKGDDYTAWYEDGKIQGKYDEARRIKSIIQSSQKEPCKGCIHDTGTETDELDCHHCKRAYSDEYEPIDAN